LIPHGWRLYPLFLFLPGCATLSYYGQALQGQADVLNRRVAIAEVLQQPATPPKLRAALQQVLEMREFASRHLHLPDNASYLSYSDLQRPFAVWNVLAAPEFSLQAVESCFPLVGCLSYRGYFAEADAKAYADELRAAGNDVFIGGVPAYSTLGWFADPMLNTVIHWQPANLAGLMFHELAHQQLYVAGDTTFNESFATAVEEAGVQQWLRAGGRETLQADWQQGKQRKAEFLALLRQTRDELQELYKQPLPVAEKRAAKQRIFEQLRARYAELKQTRWNQYSGYDAWFSQDLNNARLLTVHAYHHHVPAFLALLDSVNRDWPAFYQAAASLAALPPEQRQAELAQWADAAVR
jgi:predicted aminopeptidase